MRSKKVAKGFFIVGTDTNVGKTLISAAMLANLSDKGYRVCAIKPVASGCHIIHGELFSSDALRLKEYSTNRILPYSAINPFRFLEPISPHLAAKKNRVELSVKNIVAKSNRALTCNADYIVIEGAGGWYTPINDYETISDLAAAYDYPVILVVGIKLGCINHALLTYKCIINSKKKIIIAGWVANIIERYMLHADDNIATIKTKITAPLLGQITYKVSNELDPKNLASQLFLDALIQ